MSEQSGFQPPDPAQAEEMARQIATLTERSQRLAQAFWERQAKQASGDEFSLVDMQGVTRAFFELGAKLMSDPVKLAEAQTEFWRQNMELWQAFVTGAKPDDDKPAKADKRFRDKAWDEDLLFNYMKQSYLLTADWLQKTVHDVEGLDPKSKEKVDFYTRQFVSAMAPTNFALTNPQVLKRTRETGGENLLKGLEHMLDDLERGKGRLEIAMTDFKAFEVGQNVATTPGKVVFQNELMQLIQYSPSTETVHKRPLLFVPPWINKYYVMDLQPDNSLIRWSVEQGHTLFVISWINPKKELAHKTFEDYMLEGPLAAMEAIEQATGEKEINTLGFCIGGILMVATLAYMAAKGDDRIKSATFLATMVELKDVGETAVFVDEDQLESMEKHMAEKGYLEGHHMADMFNMMRENDLIWSFVVNNYLMGRDPMAFDLLYWNSDSTRLPAAMLLYYLRHIYMEDGLMKPGALTLDGVPIDIRKIKTPCLVVATKEDHIAPWRSGYPSTQTFGGPVTFLLGGSGHIAGIINPPTRTKYGYWLNDDYPPDPDGWLEGATYTEGSWWPEWGKWLKRRAGKRVAPREPGDGKLDIIEDAPGSFVRVRAAD